MLGKDLKPHWKLFQKLVEVDAPVVLMMDGDAADDQFEIASSLKSHGMTNVSCVWLPDGMDPGSMERTDLEAYLERAESFNDAAELTFSERILHGTKGTKKGAFKRNVRWNRDAVEKPPTKNTNSTYADAVAQATKGRAKGSGRSR